MLRVSVVSPSVFCPFYLHYLSGGGFMFFEGMFFNVYLHYLLSTWGRIHILWRHVLHQSESLNRYQWYQAHSGQLNHLRWFFCELMSKLLNEEGSYSSFTLRLVKVVLDKLLSVLLTDECHDHRKVSHYVAASLTWEFLWAPVFFSSFIYVT